MKSEKKLSDFADVVVGFPFKSSRFNVEGKGQRLVRGVNVSSQEIRWGEDTRWYEFSDYPDYCELRAGDIVIGMDGSKVGRNYSRISASDLPCLLVQRVACIRAKDEYSQDFIWACLTLGMFERYVDSIKTGTTIPHISLKQIENFPMPELSKEMQERIGQLCNLFDSAIQINAKINDYLVQISNALYDRYFPYSVDDDLPDGWKKTSLGQIIEIHDSKRIPLSAKERSELAKIYPYYGAASITDYVNDYIFDGIYLLLGEDGTVINDDGSPVLQYVFGKFWVNNHAHILTGCKGYSVDSLFLLCQRLNITSIVTGAVQPKISQSNLRSLPIVQPPIDLVESFSLVIKPLFDLFRVNSEEIKLLTKIRNQLITELFRGSDDNK